MQYTKLWKMILNGGLKPHPAHITVGRTLAEKIITATTLLDEAPRSPNADFTWDDFRGQPISLPFDCFWLEFAAQDDWVAGAYICKLGEQIHGSSMHPTPIMVQVCPIMVFGGHQPREYPGAYLNLDNNRKLVSVEFPDMCETTTVDGKRIPNIISPTVTSFVVSSLMMLSCNNISIRPNDNDPKQVKRAVKRHGGTPDSYRYYTLVIRPAGSKAGTPGQDVRDLPYHVCRGHFARYGPEFNKGLLFGKHAGLFWVGLHARGDKKFGTIEKDYKLP